MAVLLFAPPEDVGQVLIRRLTSQGDQVRVAVDAGWRSDGLWTDLGAHLARGEPDDADFVMRAALGVRTAVVFRLWGLDEEQAAEALLAGLKEAGVARVVLVDSSVTAETIRPFMESGFEYIALSTGSPAGLLRRTKEVVGPDAVAVAIDAADDLAGEPRLELDLTTEEGWRELRLEPYIPR